MSGIVFYATANHDAGVDFYRETAGMDAWLEQPDCTILRDGNLLVGFCDRDRTDDCGIVTVVHPDRAAVDDAHDRFGDAAVEEPHVNETYDIYQFFARDPDGRTVECQAFLDDDVQLP